LLTNACVFFDRFSYSNRVQPTGLRPNIGAYSLSRVRLSYFRVRTRFLIGAVRVKITQPDEHVFVSVSVTEVIPCPEEWKLLLQKFICLQRERVDHLAGCSPPVGWSGCGQSCWRSSSMAG